VVAAILVLVLALALGRGGSIVAAIHQPLWLWLGGLFGATIVLAIAYAPPRIGTFATAALLIAGQLAAGALIDAHGWFGSPRIPVTFARVAGPVLVTAGAALTLKR
jgi:transporter family-2 protein